MFIYFQIYAYKKEDIPEIRSYLEVYSDDVYTDKPKDGETCFRVKALSITYQNLFGVLVSRRDDGWQQHGSCKIPDSLDDIVEHVELFHDPNW